MSPDNSKHMLYAMKIFIVVIALTEDCKTYINNWSKSCQFHDIYREILFHWDVLEKCMFFIEKTNLGLSEEKLRWLKDMLFASQVISISKLHEKE